MSASSSSSPVAAAADPSQQAREALRERNGVRLVRNAEVGESIRRLPGGVFGFTYAPTTLEAGLFTNRAYLCFEVHRRADESVAVAAFVTAETAERLAGATDAIEIEFFPEPYEAATTLVPLEFAGMTLMKQPNRMKGNAVKAFYTRG